MGFIGSNLIRQILRTEPSYQIVNLDNLSYGSNLANLRDVESRKAYRFVKGNICDHNLVKELSVDVDAIVNAAAETHVDRSISNPRPFLDTNIAGVFNLLEACRTQDLYYVQISTDEVYGSSEDGHAYSEIERLDPSSPYSASKAAADMLVNSYHKTYGLRTLITRCTNNFGPYQFPEKLIPKVIIRASKDLQVPIYGSGRQVRDWIHVSDHCDAVKLVLSKGARGEIYNVGGGNQVENIEIVKKILQLLGKPEDLIHYSEDRPGHDFRYRLDTTKIERELGWRPKRNFDQALKETVDWYKNNEGWWQPLVNEKILSPTPWKENWYIEDSRYWR
jgi:dTDP-glucose 4,6-dehydratase